MLFSVNSYWSFPDAKSVAYGQDYHRDVSHPHFCVLFIFLTDTDAHSGAHQYIRRTHTLDSMAEVLRENRGLDRAREIFAMPGDGVGGDALYEELFGSLKETISGGAGTAFIEDVDALHRGMPPETSPRLAAWARYSVFPVVPDIEKSARAILGDGYPKSERARYVLRGIIS